MWIFFKIGSTVGFLTEKSISFYSIFYEFICWYFVGYWNIWRGENKKQHFWSVEEKKTAKYNKRSVLGPINTWLKCKLVIFFLSDCLNKHFLNFDIQKLRQCFCSLFEKQKKYLLEMSNFFLFPFFFRSFSCDMSLISLDVYVNFCFKHFYFDSSFFSFTLNNII